ncbi:hypothetical protein K2173_006163 [Erythroxylum novogranatense]|uniref:Homeobox domain-containing protein n=1 Tax=Erythroxylum novogranatense TaxID=1862640 RepID=A0AAV8TDX6_9ROSI|nr:hypothetical protein K2173_006163 [Erythroxylum novogranatense]
MCLFTPPCTFIDLSPLLSISYVFTHPLFSLSLSLSRLPCWLLFVLFLFSKAIMESQQQQQQPNQQLQPQQPPNEENNGGAKGSFLCRQSSTRWTPTTDQIRILKDLYYNTGLRSPNAEQIQRISARLRQYGKIEGKNVFYWFQNHKARERQKKRFTNDAPIQQRTVGNAANWRPDDYSFHNKCPNNSSGSSSASPSSATILSTLGQTGNYAYGSFTMEKNFRECSISAASNNGIGGGSLNHQNYKWVGVDPYSTSCTYLLENRISAKETLEDQEDQEEFEDAEATPDIETLPLFPMHRDDINGFCSIKHNPKNNCYYKNWYGGSDEHHGGSYASLELSLNSYTAQQPDSL